MNKTQKAPSMLKTFLMERNWQVGSFCSNRIYLTLQEWGEVVLWGETCYEILEHWKGKYYFPSPKLHFRSAVIGKTILRLSLVLAIFIVNSWTQSLAVIFLGDFLLVDQAYVCLLHFWEVICVGQVQITGKADHNGSADSLFCLSGHSASFPLPMSIKYQNENVSLDCRYKLLAGTVAHGEKPTQEQFSKG